MSGKEKFSMRIAVNLILIKEEKALMLRRFNTGWKDGMYSVVAGHVDGNETIAEAMSREAWEEAGLEIMPGNLKVAHVQHRISKGVEYVDFSMIAEKWSGEPKNLEPEKCDDLNWHPLSQLPENTIPYIRRVFENIEKKEMFSEWREPDA